MKWRETFKSGNEKLVFHSNEKDTNYVLFDIQGWQWPSVCSTTAASLFRNSIQLSTFRWIVVSTNAFWYVTSLNEWDFSINWFFLGDIDRLKELTLCSFEYLLAKIHSSSIEQLLWEIDVVCSNILDADVLLIQTILKNVVHIVSREPILLAGELILRLKNIKQFYNEHIEILFSQAHDWCETSITSVFVPLSSWISMIPPMTITVLPCAEGAFIIVPTIYNQHVFCTTNSHEITMHHIPSKKLVKTFTGKEMIWMNLDRNDRFNVS